MKQKNNLLVVIGTVLLMAGLLSCGDIWKSSRSSDEKNASFTLSWTAPATDEGGGELTGLSGYFVYYGDSARSGDDPKVCALCGYSEKINAGNVTTYTLHLPEGTYHFAVTAYDSSGNESAFTTPDISFTK